MTNFALERYYSAVGKRVTIGDNDIAEVLLEAVKAHFRKFPFHSLLFNLFEKKEFPLNQGQLIHNLLIEKGGSCFHHNSVFQAILKDNNIKSWFVAYLLHNPLEPGKMFGMETHVAIVFEYHGKLYLFDPGLGATSFAIYPLPIEIGAVEGANNSNYHVRCIDDNRFSFEEITTDGPVARYDFSNKPVKLKELKENIDYLNSKDYAFHTLVLYMGIVNNCVYRLINRELLTQDLTGKLLRKTKFPEHVSLLTILAELKAPRSVLMQDLNNFDFNNLELGDTFCPSHSQTPTCSPF